jgi:hypothetical protein
MMFLTMLRGAQCGGAGGGQQNGFGVQIEGNSFHNIVANCTFVNIAPPAQMHAVVLAGATAANATYRHVSKSRVRSN